MSRRLWVSCSPLRGVPIGFSATGSPSSWPSSPTPCSLSNQPENGPTKITSKSFWPTADEQRSVATRPLAGRAIVPGATRSRRTRPKRRRQSAVPLPPNAAHGDVMARLRRPYPTSAKSTYPCRLGRVVPGTAIAGCAGVLRLATQQSGLLKIPGNDARRTPSSPWT
jgi:hypothetical protein